MIVGIGSEPGLVSAYPGPWGLAGFGPILSMTAWRTGGRTGAPVAGLVGNLPSGISWVLAGWGNNISRSQSWKYIELVRP